MRRQSTRLAERNAAKEFEGAKKRKKRQLQYQHVDIGMFFGQRIKKSSAAGRFMLAVFDAKSPVVMIERLEDEEVEKLSPKNDDSADQLSRKRKSELDNCPVTSKQSKLRVSLRLQNKKNDWGNPITEEEARKAVSTLVTTPTLVTNQKTKRIYRIVEPTELSQEKTCGEPDHENENKEETPLITQNLELSQNVPVAGLISVVDVSGQEDETTTHSIDVPSGEGDKLHKISSADTEGENPTLLSVENKVEEEDDELQPLSGFPNCGDQIRHMSLKMKLIRLKNASSIPHISPTFIQPLKRTPDKSSLAKWLDSLDTSGASPQPPVGIPANGAVDLQGDGNVGGGLGNAFSLPNPRWLSEQCKNIVHLKQSLTPATNSTQTTTSQIKSLAPTTSVVSTSSVSSTTATTTSTTDLAETESLAPSTSTITNVLPTDLIVTTDLVVPQNEENTNLTTAMTASTRVRRVRFDESRNTVKRYAVDREEINYKLQKQK